MERKKYDHTKLTGNDADIETSLKEYGLAWIETDTEYLFYYGIKSEDNGCLNMDYIKFDFCAFDKTLNLFEEFDWVEWGDIYSFIGMTEDKFKNSTLPQKITDLLSYYGFKNIFGTSYWEGLDYNEIVKD